ncbi:MAG: DUF3788 domain-containing protein [Cloacibacillus porcorum]|uniref:DUF3788 domain-containing protein n=1 Tax=Cloacibacillus porcorum TaxID=1197717 RepID=UPI0023F566A1|nr:DUF3788 domain-containing protein [Cloacibacillus porcorum]MCD7877912.1 DUF3788 domain-containing protein [Cloacibacillus porcorum]
MFEKIPSDEELRVLVGEGLFAVWKGLRSMIEASYYMTGSWNGGGRLWLYEYKYRRGGKTLCSLYAKEKAVGFMVIFGRTERAKFESERETFSQKTREMYDGAKTYHDGKWMMFEPADESLFPDLIRLLRIKRRPNRPDKQEP